MSHDPLQYETAIVIQISVVPSQNFDADSGDTGKKWVNLPGLHKVDIFLENVFEFFEFINACL